MRINFTRSLAAGIIGTVAFDLVGFALTGTFWDIPALLGSKLFGEGSLVAGVLAIAVGQSLGACDDLRYRANNLRRVVLYGATSRRRSSRSGIRRDVSRDRPRASLGIRRRVGSSVPAAD